jgi:hypothetical protein
MGASAPLSLSFEGPETIPISPQILRGAGGRRLRAVDLRRAVQTDAGRSCSPSSARQDSQRANRAAASNGPSSAWSTRPQREHRSIIVWTFARQVGLGRSGSRTAGLPHALRSTRPQLSKRTGPHPGRRPSLRIERSCRPRARRSRSKPGSSHGARCRKPQSSACTD